MDEFVTFERFNSKNEASALGEFLEKKGIDFLIEDNSANVDLTFSGNLEKEFRVKLHPDDFEKAQKAVEESMNDELQDIPADYYLLSFSDAELLDVIAHKDEWSAFDFMLAQKLLRDRGRELSAEELDSIRDARMHELAKPVERQYAAIFFGYAFALFGGLIGVLIGWGLRSRKKTLPNGEIVHVYQEADRTQGRFIIYTGIFCAVIWIVLKYFVFTK